MDSVSISIPRNDKQVDGPSSFDCSIGTFSFSNDFRIISFWCTTLWRLPAIRIKSSR